MNAGRRRASRILALAALVSAGRLSASFGATALDAPNPVQSVSDDMMSGAGWLSDSATELTDALRPIFAAVPDLPAQLRRVTENIADASSGSFGLWLIQVAAAIALALIAL